MNTWEQPPLYPPVYFQGATMVEEVLSQYDLWAGAHLETHGAPLAASVAILQETMADELQAPGSQMIPAVLSNTEREIQARFDTNHNSVRQLTRAAAAALEPHLGGTERRILDQARENVENGRLQSKDLSHNLAAEVHDPLMRAAVDAGLHESVAHRLSVIMNMDGLDMQKLRATLALVGNPLMRQLIHTSLDAHVYHHLLSTVRPRGGKKQAGGFTIENLGSFLGCASGEIAWNAMRSGIDASLYNQTVNLNARSKVKATERDQLLRFASVPMVRAVIDGRTSLLRRPDGGYLYPAPSEYAADMQSLAALDPYRNLLGAAVQLAPR